MWISYCCHCCVYRAAVDAHGIAREKIWFAHVLSLYMYVCFEGVKRKVQS